MQTLHDVDALLLLATTLSSKRRPAEIVEIVAAADLLQQGDLPTETRLWESLCRLAGRGLIGEVEGGFTLTPAGQEILAGQRRNADTETRLAALRDKLAAHPGAAGAPAFPVKGGPAPIALTVGQIGVAILAHRAAGQAGGTNLLVPKPKAPAAGARRLGQRQRKPLPARQRKA